MTLWHKTILLVLLIFLGASLLIPAVWELLKPQPGIPGMTPVTQDAKNQYRALQGMMVAVGILALWACLDLENARMLVQALGTIMLAAVMARLYSLTLDGLPGAMTIVYLTVEATMAVVFLFWPPPPQ